MNLELKDKTNKSLSLDDVLFDGKEHFRLVYNEPTKEILLLNGNGYIHNITQTITSKLEKTGVFKDNEHLFEYD